MKLVITEKPSVAADIAKVIGATSRKDGYMEGNGYKVSWCVGHLIEQKTPDDYNPELKEWKLNTLPFIPQQYGYKVASKTRSQFNVLNKLMSSDDVDEIICATDAGREGELIFRLVFNSTGCKKPFKRLWLSSMSESAVKEGFANLKPGSDYDNLYLAAVARGNADWCLGINATRLFTVLYSRLLKVGRVKAPTLSMVVKREEEIKNFVKEPYFILHLTNAGLDAKSEQIKKKEEAEELKRRLEGKDGKVISVVKENKKINPPRLYNLTKLQTDANRYFGYSADEVLDIVQALYETHKISTYPRTDSEYITDDMESTVKERIKDILSRNDIFTVDLDESIYVNNTGILVNNKKVSDHHALLPTDKIRSFDFNTISSKEKNVLLLIITRLIMATGEAQEYLSTKIELDVDGEVFKQTGRVITKTGWKAVEEDLRKVLKKTENEKESDEEKAMPEVKEGQVISSCEFNITDHETKPPSRYTEGTLLTAMDKAGAKDFDKETERQGLGTSATRAQIIKELKNDGMILTEGKHLYPSNDAIKLVSVLPPELQTVDMTVQWENELLDISKGKYSAKEFMTEIEEFVRKLVNETQTAKDGVVFEGTVKNDYLGECPKCGSKVIPGKFGAYCEGKCGISINKAHGKRLTETQIKSILSGSKVLLKGLTSNKGSVYDMYVKMKGVKPYSFADKEGKKQEGFAIDYETSFPERGNYD